MPVLLRAHYFGVRLFPDGHIQVIPPNLGTGDERHLSQEESMAFFNDCIAEKLQDYFVLLTPGTEQCLDLFPPAVQAFLRAEGK